MNNINNIIGSNQLPSNNSSKNSAVGKDDFLKLMMLQMQNQDPLDPMDNQAMLSQMAQFSSLEQMSNLNENFSSSNNVGQFMDATRLLGKTVEVLDPSSPEGSPGSLSSKVQSVNFTSEGPLIKLENGIVATVQDVIKVEEPTAN